MVASISVDTTDATGKIDDASPLVIGANRNDNDGGYHWPDDRAAVIAAMQQLRTNWGSAKYGTNTFLYRIGHGITDGRNDKGGDIGYTGYRYETWFGMRNNGTTSRYPFDDIKYGLNEAEEMGATVSMVANMGSSSRAADGDTFPNETGRMAAYCNKTVNTQRHDWNLSRYTDVTKPNNGRYDVKWWEMGNEMSGSFEIGHASSQFPNDAEKNRGKNESTYAANAAKMAQAIKANSDTAGVKCGFTICTNCNFTGNGWTDGSGSLANMQTLVNNIFNNAVIGNVLQLDYCIYHGYPAWPVTTQNGTVDRIMGMTTWLQQRVDWFNQAVTAWKAAHPTVTAPAEIKLIDTEGHCDIRSDSAYGFIQAMYGLERAMHCMRNGQPICVQFCMYHNTGSLTDIPYDNLFFYKADPTKPTALFRCLRQLAGHWGSVIRKATLTGAQTKTVTGQTTPFGDTVYPVLGVAAATDTNNLYIAVLNRTEGVTETYTLGTMTGWSWTPAADSVGVYKVRSTAVNALGAWDAVSETYTTQLGNSTFTAEPMSFTILVIPKTGGGAPPPPTPPAMTVTAVAPHSGYPGDTVTITGTNMPTNPADAVADFNGKPAPLVTATATACTCKVPEGALSGQVGLTKNGETRVGAPTPAEDFTVLTRPVAQVTGFSPTFGPPGTKVRITGLNFGVVDDLEETAVFHEPDMAWSYAVDQTDTTIDFVVPEGATTGKLLVINTNWTAESAANFTVTTPFQDPPDEPGGAPGRPVLSSSSCRLYIDAQPVDGGEPYWTHWDRTDFGATSNREPALKPTGGGTFVVYALPTAMEERKGKVCLFANCDDINHKSGMLTTLAGLLHGKRRLHWGSRFVDVFFSKPREVSDNSRAASTVIGVEADFVAAQPLWKLNQPLNGVERPVNRGVEYSLFDDKTVPVQLPAYKFTGLARFTLTNWGTAWTFGAGAITNGPANGTLYLRGEGARRVPVALDKNGYGRFTEADELYLAPGDNKLRVEQENGLLFQAGASFSISFGDTYTRFL